jgi:hypothetical protein
MPVKSFLATIVIASSVLRATTAHAQQQRRPGTFAFDLSSGWLHSNVYDTRLEMADVRMGLGGAWKTPDGIAFELLGTLGLQVGETQAGRSLVGEQLFGGEIVFHWARLRLGFGGRLGGLGAKRSSNGQYDDHAFADGYGWVGVEPFVFGEGWPAFLDLEAHAIDWGGTSTGGIELRAGIRYCGKDCAF